MKRVFVNDNKIKDIKAYIYDFPILGFDEWIAKQQVLSLEAELIFKSKGIHLLLKPIKLKLYYLLPQLLGHLYTLF